jgi:two-component system cell cycle sensor histidine kinase PleC
VKSAFRAADVQPVHGDMDIFVDLSDDIMIRADRNGQLCTVNRAFYERLGHSGPEIATLNILDLVMADDRAHVRNIFLSLMRDETAVYDRVVFEARVMGADGRLRWFDWRLKRTGETVFILCRDLTQVKENESNLIRHQQQLSEAEAIAHMGYWRWVVGAQDIIWSDEIYRIFGVERGAFTPTLDGINSVLHRRDMGRIMQAFQRAMIEQNSYEMDFRITRPDGDIRFIRCEGRCELDDNGEVIALFGIMQDMTEHTRRERELREAKEATERAYAAKSTFLANMSHELRTPLNAIIGFSEMMQRQLLGPIGTERYLEYIDGIRQSGEHLLDLISDILDMSKIEAGKYSLDLDEMNVAKTTRLAVNMVESRARDACVDLSLEMITDDLVIRADRRAILQMTLNLLSNAIKFTEPGGTVRVILRDQGDTVILRVADTGIGIPANMLHVITRPFEQAANHYTRAHEGSGLGLAITKELSELHGGNLSIESEVGRGTTVTITLPKTAKTV